MRSNTPKSTLLLTRSAAAILALYGTTFSVYAQEAQPATQPAVQADGQPATDAAPAAMPDAQAPAAQSETGQAQGEDIQRVQVSARRIAESLQDVPIAVTAFSADQLSKQAVPDVTALAQALPNTTLKASRATNSTLTAFIRGVGQQDPLAGFESGVGIYLDDIYLARPQGAVMDIYDVERIEVLRGPQGTLYGRNTIGGAIKYVTRKLSRDPEARIKATIGDYGQLEGMLTASMPVTEAFRIGATAAKFQRDGYGKNYTTGRDNYDKDLEAVRVSAEWTPTTALFIRVAADGTQDDSSPKNGYRLTPGRTSGTPVLDNEYDTRGGLTLADGHEQEVRQYGVSALVEWNLTPELTFKSITANRKDYSWAPIDFDALAAVDFEVPAQYRNRQFSQEFQLAYDGGRAQGVAGIYYINAEAFNRFDTILAYPFPSSTYTMGHVETDAWAAFADGSMDVTDNLNVSLGGRYTRDGRKAKVLRQIYFGTAGSPGMGNPTAVLFRTDTDFTHGELDKEDSKFTPRASVGWKVNHAHNLYASYARGFKGGGFDPRMNVVGTKITTAQAQAGYKPETIDTYELGLKSAFMDSRIQTNAALFYSDYKDVQIPGSVAVDTNGDGVDDSFAGMTTNAAKAKIKGFELEALGRLTNALTVAGMYSYIDAEYDEYIVAGVDVSSQRRFQNTPRNSANLRATYDLALPVMSRDGTLSFMASASYRGFTYQFETPSILDQESYYLYDASVVWTRRDGKVRVGLHGKNLGDERYRTAGYLFPTLGYEGVETAFYGAPRTWSATLEYRF